MLLSPVNVNQAYSFPNNTFSTGSASSEIENIPNMDMPNFQLSDRKISLSLR